MKKKLIDIQLGNFPMEIIITLVIAGLIYMSIAAYPVKSETEVTIHGKVIGSRENKIYQNIPVNGSGYVGIFDTVEMNSEGNFQTKFKISEPVFVKTIVNGQLILLVVEPGDSFFLKYNFTGKNLETEIKGRNQAGQLLLNSLPNPRSLKIIGTTKFLDTLNLEMINYEVNKRRQEEFFKFNTLYAEGKISRAFLDFVINDRNIYYEALKAIYVWVKFIKTDPKNLDSFPSELKEFWGSIYKKNPILNNSIFSSIWWYEYATMFLKYKEYLYKDFNMEQLKEIYKSGKIHSHNLSIAQQYLDGKFLEYYMAKYLHHAAIQNDFEKELISLFDNFKNSYPKSPYLRLLAPEIKKVVAFHEKQKERFRIELIEDYDSLNSLNDCINLFNGKPLFIHFWASWCGPCIKEFKHNLNLDKALEEHGFQHLYISIDEETKIDKWKGMIKGFQLKGKHLRANKKLNADLTKIFDKGGIIEIPWYMIVNSKGEIINNHAYKPSQLSLLKEQLKDAQ